MVTQSVFGITQSGKTVHAYRLKNQHGLAVTVLDYGCTLQSVCVPHAGTCIDVCLGYDTIEEYEQNDGNMGAVIGRYAGRIPDSVLTLGEKRYPLFANDGKNHLHGGKIGFDRHVFAGEVSENSVRFTYVSPDGEEGYPAALSVSVTYLLTEDNELRMTLSAVSDGLTVWNPTNHAYWNLNGQGSGSALEHVLTIPASRFVPVDQKLIPLSESAPVEGTPFDFRSPRVLKEGFASPVIADGNGYDHSFLLDGNPITLCGNRGISMQIETDCRAVQLYTANFLGERRGKNGTVYLPHTAICLETESRQLMRHAPIPEESVVTPNTVKTHTTAYRFFCE